MYPKTYANSLFLANTLQFYASFMDFKSILEELTLTTNTNSHCTQEQLRSGTICPLQQSMHHPSQVALPAIRVLLPLAGSS